MLPRKVAGIVPEMWTRRALDPLVKAAHMSYRLQTESVRGVL